jgi:hypothetical protein
MWWSWIDELLQILLLFFCYLLILGFPKQDAHWHWGEHFSWHLAKIISSF